MAVKKIFIILSIINIIYSISFFNTFYSITDYSYAETANQSINYCYRLQWGSDGIDDGQFLRPHDVVFDSQGYVYVNDRERNDVQKFTKDGEFISKFGEKGEDLGEFKSPYSMVIDSNDHLYIIDRGNDRVQKLLINGTPIAAWDSTYGPPILFEEEENKEKENNDDDETEQNGQVKDQFASPEDMALDRNGSFYLTDTGNDRIIKFDSNFNYVSQFGISGTEPGQFNHPHGIGVDSKGNIFINELESPRIQKFTNNGTFVKQWGSNGTGPGQLTLPLEHLEVDFTDKIFMVDSAINPRVQVFDTNGTLITSFGKYGIGNAEFKKPEHVTVDSNGDVYVVDRGNQRIQVFSQC